MTDEKPFIVAYKAGACKQIKPGIHGRFESMEEARSQLQKCIEFFETGHGAGAVKAGINIDQGALDRQKANIGEQEPEEEAADEEQTELELLRKENAKLKEELACAE